MEGQCRANGGPMEGQWREKFNTRLDDCGVVRTEMIVLQCERQV